MFPVTDGIHAFTNMGEDTGGYHGYVTCCDPRRYRFKKGHSMAATADWLIDWNFVKICGEPRNKNFIKVRGGRKNKANGGKEIPANDLYCFQLLIKRNPWKWIMDYIVIIMLIDILSITAFANPIEKIPDRLMVSITMALTAMAFKVVISEKLPNLPYLTLLDWYLITTFILITVSGLYFAVLRIAIVADQHSLGNAAGVESDGSNRTSTSPNTLSFNTILNGPTLKNYDAYALIDNVVLGLTGFLVGFKQIMMFRQFQSVNKKLDQVSAKMPTDLSREHEVRCRDCCKSGLVQSTYSLSSDGPEVFAKLPLSK